MNIKKIQFNSNENKSKNAKMFASETWPGFLTHAHKCVKQPENHYCCSSFYVLFVEWDGLYILFSENTVSPEL